jgi:hypothetical protein
VALAVSQSNEYVAGKVYDAPAGWHWATAAEVEAVPGWEPKSGTRTYLNQGGWVGFEWQGVHRLRFAFRLAQAPTADTSRSVHVAAYEGMVTAGSPRDRTRFTRDALLDNVFAGVVCIQD